jgi:uncharacterized membrane-anchored protein
MSISLPRQWPLNRCTAPANGWATILLHTSRMPDEDQRSRNPQVKVVVSKDAVAERLAQLPTRKEMYRAVLLGVTTGACLVQCLAWLFR